MIHFRMMLFWASLWLASAPPAQSQAVDFRRALRSTTTHGPAFTFEPPRVPVLVDNRYGTAVRCSARGSPPPVMDWTFANGDSLGDSVDGRGGLLQILSNNSLHIRPFGAGSNALAGGGSETGGWNNVLLSGYRCSAENSIGRIISQKLKLTPVIAADVTKYEAIVGNVWVMKGNTAVFKCNIQPKFSLAYVRVRSWQSGGQNIKNDARHTVTPEGHLLVANVRKQDHSRSFRCVTDHILDRSVVVNSDPGLLHVTEPSFHTPRVEYFRERVTIRLGDTARLPCVASAYPSPSYTWSKGNVQLRTGGNVQITGGTLTLLKSQLNDSGVYNCSVSNRIGSKFARTTLIVTDTLGVELSPKSQIVDAGHSASLTCRVRGWPIKRVRWYKNGRIIQQKDGQLYEGSMAARESTLTILGSGSLSLSSDGRNLTIGTMTRKDRGMYQCFAESGEEESQGSAEIRLGASIPVFTNSQSEDSDTSEGQSVSLHCTVYGNPPPKVTWSLDGAPVEPRSNHRSDIRVGSYMMPGGDTMSHVNITLVSVLEGGKYTCSAENLVGVVSRSFSLRVYGTLVVKPMEDVVAIANRTLQLQCYVTGYPFGVPIWWKWSSMINDFRQLRINHRTAIDNNGLLTIRGALKDEDTGEYRCSVSRPSGEEPTSQNVQVSILNPPKVIMFNIQNLVEGKTMEIMCQATGDTPMTFEFRKDGEPIDSSDSPFISYDTVGDTLSMLKFTNLSVAQHNGIYMCMASNKAASDALSSRAFVQVKPYWVVEPSNDFVVLEKSVRLDCQSDGIPKPTIEWYKAPNYAQAIQPSEHHNLMKNSSLVIRNATEKDDGMYLCHAKNGVASGISQSAQLTVHIPARFEKSSKSNTFRKGSKAQLNCEAKGDVPLNVVWFKEGVPILNGSRFIIREHSVRPKVKLSVLEIAETSRGDTGRYRCSATNQFGNSTLIFNTIIIETPTSPNGIQVLSSTSRSLGLSWNTPFNGNLPLLSYKIQYKLDIEPWSVCKNQTVSANVTSAMVRDLLPYRVYSLRLLSQNSLGYSQPGKFVSRLTGEEAPSGPPVNVTLTAVGSKEIKINWAPPAPGLRNGIITHYTLEYRQYNTSREYTPINIPADQFHGSYDLDGLSRFTKYEVLLSGRTVVGRGPKSQVQVTVTLEDVPSMPPKNVRAFQGASKNSVHVVWKSPDLSSLHGILAGYKVLYTPVRSDQDEGLLRTKTERRLKTEIADLESYTNYSIQVLAFTRKGDGAQSSPVYIFTPPSEPSRPAGIRVIPSSSTSLTVAWKGPNQQNGEFEKYSIYLRHTRSGSLIREIIFTKENLTTVYKIRGLDPGRSYSVQVAAKNKNTSYGPSTTLVSAVTTSAGPAAILSFPQKVTADWHTTVLLQCQALGQPVPSVVWKKNGVPVQQGSLTRVLANHSLVLREVDTVHSGNYTCTATNSHGVSSQNNQVLVRVSEPAGRPPNPPSLILITEDYTFIQIRWASGQNGGSPIIGFLVQYKRAHADEWSKVRVPSSNRTYTADELACGSQYMFRMKAISSLGESIENSDVLRGRTDGSAPIAPDSSRLLAAVNQTYADIDLSSWSNGGCPITGFTIQYRHFEKTEWTGYVEVNDEIDSKPRTSGPRRSGRDKMRKIKRISDLQFGSWYTMRVTATNPAGSTSKELTFGTLTPVGNTPVTKFSESRDDLAPPLHAQVKVVVPVVGVASTILVCLLVMTLLFIRRRKLAQRLEGPKMQQYRNSFHSGDTASLSQRTDPPQPIPPMLNDLDRKRSTGTGSGDRIRFGSRDIRNLRCVSGLSGLGGGEGGPPESISHESQMWLLHRHQSGLTESDNMCMGGTADYSDSEINPYATFCRSAIVGDKYSLADDSDSGDSATDSMEKHKFVSELSLPASSEEEDEITRQKRKNKEYEGLFSDADFPPPPTHHELLATLMEDPNEPQPAPSMKKFASEKRLYRAHPKPELRPNTTGPYPPAATPDSIALSRFKSFLSSMTTVSSNQEELMTAYQNSKLHPLSPIVFESPNVQAITPLSRPTPEDSSDHLTESGILEFTQCPPRPEEQRQAVCEVPLWRGGGRRVRDTPIRHGSITGADLSSDTTTTTDHDMLGAVGGSHRQYASSLRQKSPQKKPARRKAKALTSSQRKLRAQSRSSNRSKSRASERGYDEACDLISTLTKSYVRAESPSETSLNHPSGERASSSRPGSHGYTYTYPARQKKRIISPSCIANQTEENEPLMGGHSDQWHPQAHTLPQSLTPQHHRRQPAPQREGKGEDPKVLDRYYRARKTEQKSPSPREYTDKFTIV